ncbi:MAG: iron-sulfur cluster assembly scaffold protein [Patescibacteria group bacterium]
MYSNKVLEHFQNPHNQGQIPDASGVGEVGNPVCGDMMKIYLKVKSDGSDNIDNHIIEDIKFETLGCGAAIASTSMLTDLVKDKTIKESLEITKQDVADSLGGLPKPKVHCSVLAVDGLKEAVEDYRIKLSS